MPSFDIVSEVDLAEVRNAVDQAAREVATRFDFKDTGTSVALRDRTIELRSETENRLEALRVVLEEKLVRRKVPTKALQYGKVEAAARGTVRQEARIQIGIPEDRAREIGKFIKGLGIKGVQHQVQGDQLRVTSKQRDDLQAVIAQLRDRDFGLPLQFTNYRD